MHYFWKCLVPNLLVLRLEYIRKFRSTPWLLMPWLLVSPRHQQPWHWLPRMNGSLSFIRKNFQLPLPSLIGRWKKMQIYFDGLVEDCNNSNALAIDFSLSSQTIHHIHYTQRIMHIIYALLWFGTCQFYPYPSGLLHWHWGNHMIAPVSVK